MESRYLYRGKRIDNGEWVEGYLSYPFCTEKGNESYYFYAKDSLDFFCRCVVDASTFVHHPFSCHTTRFLVSSSGNSTSICPERISFSKIKAIEALEEIQQYRAIGTAEELQEMKKDFAEALSDWRQYAISRTSIFKTSWA